MQLKRIIGVAAIGGAALTPLILARPAWAITGGQLPSVTTFDTGSSAGIGVTIQAGGSSGSGGQNGTPGSPPSSAPPSNKTTKTYPAPSTPPKGCSASWYGSASALGKALGGATMTATCTGNGAAQSLNYYGTPTPTCTVVKGKNYCSIVITWTPGSSVPGSQGTPAIPPTTSGLPSQLVQLEDSVTAPAPKIGQIVPNPFDPSAPYVYTLYPTQVSVAPGSLPPTITKSSTVTASASVSSSCQQLVLNAQGQPVLNAQGQKQYQTTSCSKTYTYPVVATVTATLQGYEWIPEAADVNGRLNVAVPQGETAGAQQGSVVCGLQQNSTDMSNNNNIFNPSICTIDFTQPSTKAGFWLKAEGVYNAVGEIRYTTPWNGKTTVLGPYVLGTIMGQPATTQVQVAVVEAVQCSTAACYNAGLAQSNENVVPLD